ncbi:MAG: hypothetical protein DRP27_10210, partial [Thermotogae bacterium]
MDDAFITYRYSENLANTGEISWNPGDREFGFSSLAWVLVNALAIKFGLSLPMAAKLLSLISTLLVAWIIHKKVKGELAKGLLASVFLLFPYTWFHAISGMETMFFTLILTLYYLLSERILFGDRVSLCDRALLILIGVLLAITRLE